MWTLILTILWFHAPAVTSIPGFTSYEACNNAAKAEQSVLLAEERGDQYFPAVVHATYVCVKL